MDANIFMKKLLYIILFVPIFSCHSSNEEYYNYLLHLHKNIHDTDFSQFYNKAANFWFKRLDTLTESSLKRNDTLKLFLSLQDSLRHHLSLDPQRFKQEIEKFEEYDSENTHINHPILFIGSSTINLWKTAQYFPNRQVLNRGFGGANIQDILYYYNQVIKKYNPSSIVLYNDIDVENGESPQYTINQYIKLIHKIHQDFPYCKIIIISIKPTPLDILLGKSIRQNKKITNDLLKELTINYSYLEFIDLSSLLYDLNGNLKNEFYREDKQHLTEECYKLWSNELNKYIK